MFLHDYIQVIHFWQDYSISDAVSFLVHSIRRHIMSVCPIINNVNFDHLIKVVSAKFLQICVLLLLLLF